MSTMPSPTHGRPRVEGAREDEILQTTLQLLAEVGYDNLTMDAVASAARASKATLYRRWFSKAELVVDALDRMKGPVEQDPSDTGSLRTDLLAAACSAGGITDEFGLSVIGSIVTVIQRDEEFAAAFREHFVARRVAYQRKIFERAIARGEIPAGVEVDSLLFVLPSLCMYQAYVLGKHVTPDTVSRVVDDVVMPAVHHQVRLHEARRPSRTRTTIPHAKKTE